MSALQPQPWVLIEGAPAVGDLFTDLAFSAGGQLLVAGGSGGSSAVATGRDLHLSLRDWRGRPLWKWSLPNPGEDAFQALAIYGDSYVLAAGFMEAEGGGHRDAVLLLFDSATGDWPGRFFPLASDTASDDQFNDLAIASDGTIVLVGVSRGAGRIGGQVKANPVPVAGERGFGDGLLTIIPPTPQALPITRLIGRAGDDDLEAVTLVPGTTAGGTSLVVAGSLTEGANDRQAYLAAYDVTGQQRWERLLGAVGSFDRFTALVSDATTVYAAGITRGTMPESGSSRDPARRDADLFVAAFDLSGSLRWLRQLDASAQDETTAKLALAGNRLELVADDGRDLLRASLTLAGEVQETSRLTRGVGVDAAVGSSAILADGQGNIILSGAGSGAWAGAVVAGGSADALLYFTGPQLSAYQLDVQPIGGDGALQSTRFQLDPGPGQSFEPGLLAALTGYLEVDELGNATYTPYAELPVLAAWTNSVEDSLPLFLRNAAGQRVLSRELVLRVAAPPSSRQRLTLAANQATAQVKPLGLGRPELGLSLSDTTYTTSRGSTNQLSAFGGERAQVSLQLAVDRAPVTALNALRYARELLYNRTVFHRVLQPSDSIQVVQGGGFNADALKADGFGAIQSFSPIPLEGTSTSGLSNRRGTVAMARTNQPHSATGQFFVNVIDNLVLDDRAPIQEDLSANPGYAVFAAVASGLDVFEAIAKAPHRNSTLGGADTRWGAQNSGALFEDITEPVVVIEQTNIAPLPTQLTYSLETAPSHGRVELDGASGKVEYIPFATYSGQDRFQLRISTPALSGLPERSIIQDFEVEGAITPQEVSLPATQLGFRFNSSQSTSPWLRITSQGSPDLLELSDPLDVQVHGVVTGVWDGSFEAQNVGSPAAPGTGERLPLQGLGRYSFVAMAHPDAITSIVLEPNRDTAYFLHDSYSAFFDGLELSPDNLGRDSAQRLLNIDTIRMGSAGGRSIVDLTSRDYLTGAVSVYGAPRGTSVVWGGAANDRFISGGGDAVIYGGKGSNHLQLGSGSEILQYRPGVNASDTVSGFDPTQDRLELWLGPDQVVSAPQLSASGGSTELRWGGNTLNFAGLSALSLESLQISYSQSPW
jgi:cyclophilin family peptidyl-prolyl cis-trans isomerase